MISLGWVIGLVVVLILALSFYGSLEITRIPYLAVPYTPEELGWPYEAVSFTTEDGLRLTGWFCPAAKPSSITIIVQHGIGSNHGDMLRDAEVLHKDGRWNLFFYNFRGHADSEGTLTSLGPLEVRDMRAALKFLQDQKPQEAKRIGLFGHSLGAAVGIVGAAEMPEIEAVAAESSFASISHTVRRFSTLYHGIPYFPFIPLALYFTSLRLGLRMGKFNPVKAIGKIAPRPLYLMQGDRDLRVPMADFQALWSAARQPKEQWIVPGADHGDPLIIDKETYEKRLVEFFGKAFA